MAQMKQKAEPLHFVRGQKFKATDGEELTVLETQGKIFVKVLRGNGKIDMMGREHLEWRIGHDPKATD